MDPLQTLKIRCEPGLGVALSSGGDCLEEIWVPLEEFVRHPDEFFYGPNDWRFLRDPKEPQRQSAMAMHRAEPGCSTLEQAQPHESMALATQNSDLPRQNRLHSLLSKLVLRRSATSAKPRVRQEPFFLIQLIRDVPELLTLVIKALPVDQLGLFHTTTNNKPRSIFDLVMGHCSPSADDVEKLAAKRALLEILIDREPPEIFLRNDPGNPIISLLIGGSRDLAIKVIRKYPQLLVKAETPLYENTNGRVLVSGFQMLAERGSRESDQANYASTVLAAALENISHADLVRSCFASADKDTWSTPRLNIVNIIGQAILYSRQTGGQGEIPIAILDALFPLDQEKQKSRKLLEAVVQGMNDDPEISARLKRQPPCPALLQIATKLTEISARLQDQAPLGLGRFLEESV